MTTYQDYQTVPDDNQAAPPVGAPEGSYPGNVVNNTFREMMSVIRQLGDSALHSDGRNKPSADIDWNLNKILNLKFGTARSQAAAVGQIQDGSPTWGGTSTGSGTAYVLSLSPLHSGSTYAGGFRVRFLAHVTNTSTTPTLKVDSGPAGTMTHRNGGALQVGAIILGRRYEAEWDGSKFRVLDAGGYMEQASYDLTWPIGTVMVRHDTLDPNTVAKPAGVTATWVQIDDSGHLMKIASGTAPGTVGGSADTGSTALTASQIPTHAHRVMRDQANSDSSPSGLNADNNLGWENSAGANRAYVAASVTAGSFVGLSESVGGGQGHTHSVDPPHRTYRSWRRTA